MLSGGYTLYADTGSLPNPAQGCSAGLCPLDEAYSRVYRRFGC